MYHHLHSLHEWYLSVHSVPTFLKYSYVFPSLRFPLQSRWIISPNVSFSQRVTLYSLSWTLCTFFWFQDTVSPRRNTPTGRSLLNWLQACRMIRRRTKEAKGDQIPINMPTSLICAIAWQKDECFESTIAVLWLLRNLETQYSTKKVH